MRVVWTENALLKLQEIEDYIAQTSPETAKRWIDRLIRKGEGLSHFPNIGRRVPELNSDKIREVLEENYRIVYRVKEHLLEILTVFEGHHLLPEPSQPADWENADRVQEKIPSKQPMARRKKRVAARAA